MTAELLLEVARMFDPNAKQRCLHDMGAPLIIIVDFVLPTFTRMSLLWTPGRIANLYTSPPKFNHFNEWYSDTLTLVAAIEDLIARNY